MRSATARVMRSDSVMCAFERDDEGPVNCTLFIFFPSTADRLRTYKRRPSYKRRPPMVRKTLISVSPSRAMSSGAPPSAGAASRFRLVASRAGWFAARAFLRCLSTKAATLAPRTAARDPSRGIGETPVQSGHDHASRLFDDSSSSPTHSGWYHESSPSCDEHPRKNASGSSSARQTQYRTSPSPSISVASPSPARPWAVLEARGGAFKVRTG